MTGTFHVAVPHAVTLADGRVRGITDPDFDLEPGDDHNQALEDAGLIVRRREPARRARKTEEED